MLHKQNQFRTILLFLIVTVYYSSATLCHAGVGGYDRTSFEDRTALHPFRELHPIQGTSGYRTNFMGTVYDFGSFAKLASYLNQGSKPVQTEFETATEYSNRLRLYNQASNTGKPFRIHTPVLELPKYSVQHGGFPIQIVFHNESAVQYFNFTDKVVERYVNKYLTDSVLCQLHKDFGAFIYCNKYWQSYRKPKWSVENFRHPISSSAYAKIHFKYRIDSLLIKVPNRSEAKELRDSESKSGWTGHSVIIEGKLVKTSKKNELVTNDISLGRHDGGDYFASGKLFYDYYVIEITKFVLRHSNGKEYPLIPM